MNESSRDPGLSLENAVRLLLTHLGVDYEPPPEGPEEAGTPDHLLSRLEQLGLNVRLAQLDPADLPSLECPTLVQVHGSRWLIFLKKKRGGIVTVDAAGERRFLSWRGVEDAFAGAAVESIPDLPAGRTLWVRVGQLVWAHRRLLYQSAVLALIVQSLNLAFPELTRVLVDRAFPEGTSNLLQVVILAMMLVAFFQAWTGWLERRLAVHLQIRLDAILERGLLIHVLHLPYGFLERKTIGQLLQGFQGFVMARDLLTGESVGAFLGGITAVVFLILMGRMMPAAAILVAAAEMVAGVITVAGGKRQEFLQHQHVKAFTKQRGYAAELLNHIAMLKAAGAENRSASHWLTLLRRERDIKLHIDRVQLGANVAVGLFGQIELQILWIWGGLRVLEGSLQLGELLAFTLMASAFHKAVSSLGNSLITVWTVKPYLLEAQSLLARQSLTSDRSREVRRAPGPVEVRDLWFRYGPTLPWILEGFEMSVAPGEVRRIEGPSGFGKSTLLKLIAGLYEPDCGNVLLAGRPPRKARGQFLYLPQFVRLFNTTILENLRLLSNGAPRNHLTAVAELTGLAAIVEGLPMGYETLLAQGGENFSGGQRQLIALTAALSTDRGLLLLDEAMANIDPLQWAKLVKNPLFQDKTILYTSHDKTAWEMGQTS
jgi:ABC-type bacteriocin/lantibiotic exporter with double-glycine peptidase domain